MSGSLSVSAFHGGWTPFALERFESELAEVIGDFLGGQRHAEQLRDLLRSQRDVPGCGGLRVGVHHPFGQRAASRFEDELRGSSAGPVADADVRPAFEAVAGIRAQPERLAGAADVGGIEVRGLDQHVHRLIVDLRVLSAHHACQRNALLLVGDQQVVPGEGVFLAVEGGECLAVAGAADDDCSTGVPPVLSSRDGWAGLEQMIVERVQRLADLHHHVVGDIHHVVDAAQPDPFQGGSEPARAGADLDPLDHARGVAGAQRGVLDSDGEEVLAQRRGRPA